MPDQAAKEALPRKFPSKTKADPALTRGFAIEAARLLYDDKCENVLVLDVSSISQVTDFIVIGSGTSDRQMKSVIEHVEDLAQEHKFDSFGKSIDTGATWLLIDFVDVVIHLFEPNTRAHYDLEMLWGDADHVQWQRPDQINRDRAGLHGESWNGQ